MNAAFNEERNPADLGNGQCRPSEENRKSIENCQPATSSMSYEDQAIQYNEFTTIMLNEVDTKLNFTYILSEKNSLLLSIKTRFKCFSNP